MSSIGAGNTTDPDTEPVEIGGDRLEGVLLGGRYQLANKLGSGGMSAVYLAADTVLERQVAVKVLHSDRARESGFIERFKQEAKDVAKLSHSHLVKVIDAGEDGGRPYIVFEYVGGETLKQHIRHTGRLPITDAIAYAIEIGQALTVAHDSQLVHRDIKPQNILLDQYGHAKLTDFGIARSLAGDGLTEPGKVLGTTEYISPEQALGHEVDYQSDIYSLGIVLYEMLTGEVPFRGDNPVTVATKHVREELPDVKRKRPQVSSALAGICERATAKEPTARYSSVASMVADLEEVLSFEISRSGHSSDEATVVLEELHGDPDTVITRPSFRLRHRLLARALRLSVFVVLPLIAVGAAFLLLVPDLYKAPKQSGESLRGITLKGSDVRDYDPPPGDGKEHGEFVGNVVDGIPTSSWSSEIYADRGMGKNGVGLLFDAGKPIAAIILEADAPKAGYDAEVFGSNNVPTKVGTGWTLLAQINAANNRQQFKLDTVNRRFRYYLLWVTRLPPQTPYQQSFSSVRIKARG